MRAQASKETSGRFNAAIVSFHSQSQFVGRGFSRQVSFLEANGGTFAGPSESTVQIRQNAHTLTKPCDARQSCLSYRIRERSSIASRSGRTAGAMPRNDFRK